MTTWICPYCGAEKPFDYEPWEWSHCGFIGHAITEAEYDAIWAQNTLPQERDDERDYQA